MIKLHDQEIEVGNRIWSITMGWSTVILVEDNYITVRFDDFELDTPLLQSDLDQVLKNGISIFYWTEFSGHFAEVNKLKPVPKIEHEYYTRYTDLNGHSELRKTDLDNMERWDFKFTFTDKVLTEIISKGKKYALVE